MIFFAIVALLGGLFLLIKGSDIVVESSVKVAKLLNVSEMLIGLTLVCFGTSLPELFLSVNGSLKGTSSLVIGNLVGTNIFNIAAILAVVCLITPLKLLRDTVRKDMEMSFVTGVAFLMLIMDSIASPSALNILSRTDGVILLLLFAIYMYYTLYEFGGITERGRKRITERFSTEKAAKTLLSKENKIEFIKSILICIMGCIMVYVGSESVLYGATKLAETVGISQTLIAVLIIAAGTSLPEIVTSITAIKKGSINIAIGNLIGSNMFNLLFVPGVAALVNPIYLVSSAIWVDCIVFITICAIVVIFAKARFLNKGQYELSRLEGVVLLAIYISYVIYAVFRG